MAYVEPFGSGKQEFDFKLVIWQRVLQRNLLGVLQKTVSNETTKTLIQILMKLMRNFSLTVVGSGCRWQPYCSSSWQLPGKLKLY